MGLEFALQAVKFGSWGPSGSSVGIDRVGPAAGAICIGRERVAIFGGGQDNGGASLRLVHVFSSDSTRAPPQLKRKHKSRANELKFLKELQEFIVSHDLSPNQIPTTRDLASNGRQDLANQLRRKGYKLVGQLLEQVHIAETGETSQSKEIIAPAIDSVVSKEGRNEALGLPSAETDEPFSNDVKEPQDVGSSSHEGLEGLPWPGGSGTMHGTNGYASHTETMVRGALGEQLMLVPEDGRDQRIKVESARQTLQETEGVTQESHQDMDGDLSGTRRQNVSVEEVTDEEDDSGEEEFEVDDMEDDDDDYGPNSQSPAVQKAALLKAKILQYFESRRDDLKKPKSFQNADSTMKEVAMQRDEAEVVLGDVEFQTEKFETQKKELERLKVLLYSRELELAEISRQLEEAKGMLSLARSKATAEFVHAKQLAVEQDVRLQAAEQALSQLKQVHLEWWGEARQVEVCGSFNGWQHQILLQPDYTSEIPKQDAARGPMMWGTHLCLYPGVYEIKFIVDGNWQVDHRREVVMRHTIQNNVLRVE